jgi:putative peptide zinc metalloprotease protein
VAAAAYRWVVVLSILYFLNKVFEPYGLKVLGQLIAAGAVYGLLIQPLVNVVKFFRVPGRLGKVKRWRMYTTIGVIVVAIAAVFLVPLPAHVYCPLEVQARGADSVYVEEDGILEEVLVKPGDHVEVGEALARLSNIDLEISIAELTGERDVYTAQLQGLHRISFEDPRASGEIERVTEALNGVKSQLEKRVTDQQKLQLVAPQAGTVLPPPLVPEQPSDDDQQLPRWSGSPFQDQNLGATLLKGTKFCQIGDPSRLEARLVIDQGDFAFVEPDQRVEIMLNQSAETVYVSRIEKKSLKTVKESPAHLSSLHGGELATQMGPDGVARPLSPVFDALVPLPEDKEGLLRIGLVGRAKIATAPRTLADRLWRYLSRTFNFEL